MRRLPSGVRDMATKDTGGGQQRANRSSEEVEETEVEANDTSDLKERKAKLDDDVDAVLDDIDEILESDAESFVRAYVQKGGE
jgi:ubiquitin-like protein Pup